MAENNYDPQSVYEAFSETTIPSECGCGVVGLVRIKSCKDGSEGYLTPHDAELYHIGTIETPPGFVKFFHPVTEVFLGVLTVEQAIAYSETLS